MCSIKEKKENQQYQASCSSLALDHQKAVIYKSLLIIFMFLFIYLIQFVSHFLLKAPKVAHTQKNQLKSNDKIQNKCLKNIHI